MKNPAALGERMASLCGREAIRAVGSGGECRAHAVDGVEPAVVVAPADEQAAAAVLTVAHELGLGVVPRGGGTALGIGNPPTRLDVVLDLGRLRGVVRHEPADLVVTLAGGTPLSEAVAAVGEHRQRLPLEPPGLDAGATVGGAVASGLSGPRRPILGSPRERLVGVRVVMGDGTITTAGGQVTKNVAGYDLPRLYAGSLGGLAVILEASFKVSPLPERQAALVISHATLEGLAEVQRRLLALGLPLAGLEIEMASPDTRHLVVLLEGSEAGVARCERDACEVAGAVSPAAEVRALESHAVPEEITRLRDASWSAARADPAACWLRASVGPAQTLAAAAEAMRLGEGYGVSVSVSGRAANGVVEVVVGGGGQTPEPQVAVVQDLRRFAARRGGEVVVLAAPLALKTAGDVFGPPTSATLLGHAVKRALDPAGVLSPGRGWGGV